ncbi:MAG: hypothetical protein HPY51_01520 [Candidatus Omnitrophica bacterium]|nr:hypothetical protein [Candidatus Omnitrophota bacterium]HPP02861.1 hypothetical protein [bacterium]
MRKNDLKRLILLAGMAIGMALLGARTVSAQTLMPLYPGPGMTVRFQDLVDNGFHWAYPPGATAFEVLLLPPAASFPQPIRFPASVSPYRIDAAIVSYLRSVLPDGVYQWRVEITSGTGAGTVSDYVTFNLKNQSPLIPTPTPPVKPTPAGNLDGTGKIDAGDIFILSRLWKVFDPSIEMGPDLNRDAVVDGRDLLLYIQRYGQPAPTATPAPPLGVPRHLTFYPNSIVSIAETPILEIRWDRPSYPEGQPFVYDVLILRPDGNSIEATGLAATSYKPFGTLMTLTGKYTVHVRARLTGGGDGNIVSGEFQIVLNRPVTPTPTPVPRHPDLSGDGLAGVLDLSLFARAFGSWQGQEPFCPEADLIGDGKIDQYDLLVYYILYSRRYQQLAAPVWLYADVPVLDPATFCGRVGEDYTRVNFPPNELMLGFSSKLCVLAELYQTVLAFSEVPGAADYRVTVVSETDPGYFRAFYTNGETKLVERFDRFVPGDVLRVQVQAAGADRSVGESSEILRIIVPSQN